MNTISYNRKKKFVAITLNNKTHYFYKNEEVASNKVSILNESLFVYNNTEIPLKTYTLLDTHNRDIFATANGVIVAIIDGTISYNFSLSVVLDVRRISSYSCAITFRNISYKIERKIFLPSIDYKFISTSVVSSERYSLVRYIKAIMVEDDYRCLLVQYNLGMSHKEYLSYLENLKKQREDRLNLLKHEKKEIKRNISLLELEISSFDSMIKKVSKL